MLQKQHKYHVSTLKPLPLSGFLYRKAGLICYRRGSAIFLRDFIKADWLAENAGTNIDQRERFYLKKLAPSAAKVWKIQSFGDG
ncbi:hypothetical protein RB2083_3213 [Rhodobacteraceae bacterium HTCC2083]|jgi:hypothetical protein|nr:hypothetical protein RB2083_3213 [Rhodobacteraceae bacterium HTCC2083]